MFARKKIFVEKHWHYKWAVKEEMILDWASAILRFQCLNSTTLQYLAIHSYRGKKTLERSGKGKRKSSLGLQTAEITHCRREPFSTIFS